MEKIKWLDVLLVVVKALLAGLAAVAADTASGQPLAALLEQLHPASVLLGGAVAAPLALLKRSASSSKPPATRRSVRGTQST